MKIFRKSLLLIASLFMLVGCGETTPTQKTDVPSEPTEVVRVNNLIVSSSKESFTYGEKLNIADFEVKNKDGEKIKPSNIVIENFDAYGYGEQKVIFSEKDTNNYGEFTIKKLTPIDGMKVLFIANSHAQDLLRYTHELAESAGLKNFRFCNMFWPGAQMGMHYESREETIDGFYTFEDYKGGEPEKRINSTLLYGLGVDDWDYIVLQQSSGLNKNKAYVKTMDSLIDFCRDHCSNKNVKFLFNFSFGYTDMGSGNTTLKQFFDNDPHKMYQVISDTTRNYVATDPKIDAVIPTATAAENAGTSYITINGMHRDDVHMNDIGKFIIGHTFVAKISGVDVDKITYKGNFEDKAKKVAIESTINALINPFEATQSQYK